MDTPEPSPTAATPTATTTITNPATDFLNSQFSSSVISPTPGGTSKLPSATTHLRIARPSRDLAAIQKFWVDGLGLKVLWHSGPPHETEGGHELLMVGWPGAAWHLEIVHDSHGDTPPTPTEEDLLVLYLNGLVDPVVVNKLIQAGGTRVIHKNEYWQKWGVTIADPDGYLLVLCTRAWENQ